MLRTNTACRRALTLREAASAALVRLDHAGRYRRAISHGARPEMPTYSKGTQVCYWRRGKARPNLKGRRIRDIERWRGPGIIVGEEQEQGGQRRGYWVSHAGSFS